MMLTFLQTMIIITIGLVLSMFVTANSHAREMPGIHGAGADSSPYALVMKMDYK